MHDDDASMRPKRDAGFVCATTVLAALCLLAAFGRGPNAWQTLAAAGATPIAETSPAAPTPTPSPTSTPTATATPVDPIVVTALDPQLVLIPSATATAHFRVANTGAAPVVVAIAAACSQPKWCVGPILADDGAPIPSSLDLAAGQSIVVELSIAVPADARLDDHATIRVLATVLTAG